MVWKVFHNIISSIPQGLPTSPLYKATWSCLCFTKKQDVWTIIHMQYYFLLSLLLTRSLHHQCSTAQISTPWWRFLQIAKYKVSEFHYLFQRCSANYHFNLLCRNTFIHKPFFKQVTYIHLLKMPYFIVHSFKYMFVTWSYIVDWLRSW